MNKKKVASIVLLLVCLPMCIIANARVFQKDEFSISLPEGWVEIPRGVLDTFEEKSSDLVPNAEKQHYNCGFQLESSEYWLEHPYILVQLKNTGRVSENELQKLEGYSGQKVVEKRTAGSILSNWDVGKMIYDRENRIIWVRMESDVENVGRIAVLGGMIPTQKGFINVYGYVRTQDYSTYENIFQAVAKSISPEPMYVYKPKWSDKLPINVSRINWGEVIGYAIAGAIFVGIGEWIAIVRKRKNV